MKRRIAWVAYIVSGLSGVVIWVTISLLTGKDEAWDSSYYYRYGFPLMFFIAGFLGFLVPVKVWRWGVTMLGSQALFLLIQKPTANLLPPGIILFGVFSIPCIVASYIGAFLRNKFQAKRNNV